MFERQLILPEPGSETFFLWGPRQTGKSVCREPRARRTDDGIEVLPAATFAKQLWSDAIVF